jgi:hypothetical protein
VLFDLANYGTQEYALETAEFQARLEKARASWPKG